MKDNVASAWVNIKGANTEKEIALTPETILLTGKTVAWLDLMYDVWPLKTGETITVPVLNPDELETSELEIDIRESKEAIDMGGKIYSVFVCDAGSLAQVHYVTPEGQLLKVEQPDLNVTITLIESGLTK